MPVNHRWCSEPCTGTSQLISFKDTQKIYKHIESVTRTKLTAAPLTILIREIVHIDHAGTGHDRHDSTRDSEGSEINLLGRGTEDDVKRSDQHHIVIKVIENDWLDPRDRGQPYRLGCHEEVQQQALIGDPDGVGTRNASNHLAIRTRLSWGVRGIYSDINSRPAGLAFEVLVVPSACSTTEERGEAIGTEVLVPRGILDHIGEERLVCEVIDEREELDAVVVCHRAEEH